MAQKRQMKKMGGPVWYRSWKPTTSGKNKGSGGWDEGDMVGGTLVDTSLDKKYKRLNYHIKVEEFNFDCENQDGDPLKIGDVLVLNGCGTLEKYFANLKRGEYVEVVYEGEAEIKSGDWEGEMAISLSVSIEEGSGEGALETAPESEEGDESSLL